MGKLLQQCLERLFLVFRGNQDIDVFGEPGLFIQPKAPWAPISTNETLARLRLSITSVGEMERGM
jgi:hypothetical protein